MAVGSARRTVIGVRSTRSVGARLSAVVGARLSAVVGARLSTVVGVVGTAAIVGVVRAAAVVGISAAAIVRIVGASAVVGVVGSARPTVVGVGSARAIVGIVSAPAVVGVVGSARPTVVGIGSPRPLGGVGVPAGVLCWGCVRRLRRPVRSGCAGCGRCRCILVLSRSNLCYCEENQRYGPNRQDVLSFAAQIHKPLLREREAFTQSARPECREWRFHPTLRSPRIFFDENSSVSVSLGEGSATTLEVWAISHRFPPPVKGSQKRKRKATTRSVLPASFLLCFHSALRKGLRKTVMPFSNILQARLRSRRVDPIRRRREGRASFLVNSCVMPG